MSCHVMSCHGHVTPPRETTRHPPDRIWIRTYSLCLLGGASDDVLPRASLRRRRQPRRTLPHRHRPVPPPPPSTRRTHRVLCVPSRTELYATPSRRHQRSGRGSLNMDHSLPYDDPPNPPRGPPPPKHRTPPWPHPRDKVFQRFRAATSPRSLVCHGWKRGWKICSTTDWRWGWTTRRITTPRTRRGVSRDDEEEKEEGNPHLLSPVVATVNPPTLERGSYRPTAMMHQRGRTGRGRGRDRGRDQDPGTCPNPPARTS